MPIPVYTQDVPATTAVKADGVTPKTAPPQANAPLTVPAPARATTTATPTKTSPPYPQAQAAHGIVPAPTNSRSQPTGPASNYNPLPKPTPTRTYQPEWEEEKDEGPPAPRPGAMPVPPGEAKSSLPPPPKVGEKYVPPAPAPSQQAQPQPQPAANRAMPPQMGYAPPNSTYQPATKSTVQASTPTRTYGAPLSYNSPAVGGGEDERLDHPPGYHQNLYAAQQTPQQRQASVAAGSNSGYHRAGTMNDGPEEESIWDTAKSWAFSAGKKMAETEAEIWKRINGEK